MIQKLLPEKWIKKIKYDSSDPNHNYWNETQTISPIIIAIHLQGVQVVSSPQSLRNWSTKP